MGYKIRNNIFTVILFVILAFVIFFAIWKLAYGSMACDPIATKSEAYSLTYNDLIHTYEGTVDNKYNVSFLEPTLLKFNAEANVSEKPSVFYKSTGGSQIILTLGIAPKVGASDFTYTVYFEEIVSSSAATKTDKGSVVIDPDTLEVTEDNSAGISTDSYTTRIQNLINVANEVWGDSIVAD